MRRVRVIGIGSGGLDQVTVEAVQAMNEVDYFLVTDKRKKDGSLDPLVAARGEILSRHLDHEPRLVVVDDPSRDRSEDGTRTAAEYDRAVSEWHEARTDAWEQALLEHDGDAGFLVWGDPAFYDSAIRVARRGARTRSGRSRARRRARHLQPAGAGRTTPASCCTRSATRSTSPRGAA